jgi:hypothetical protein
MGKVEVSVQLRGNLLMARKLSPIVAGDGVQALRQWQK